MKNKIPGKGGYAAVVAMVLISIPCLLLAAGCGSSSDMPTLISFMGESSESARNMKPIIDDLKEKFDGKVIFIDVDMDDPASEKKMEEYYVSMNPTFIVLNREGQVRETFMGSAQEEMLFRSLMAFLPPEAAEGIAPDPAPVPGSVPDPDDPVQVIPSEPVPVPVPPQ